MANEGYTVFAQQEGARLDVAGWHRYAQSFFDASVQESELDPDVVALGDARVIVSGRDRQPATRTVAARPRTHDDLRAAENAEKNHGGAGLSLLAKRCPTVILVRFEGEADSAALLLSAIIAGVGLGPILTPDRSQIWGVKTARRELEKMMTAS
jgi:hypothetical protein